MEQRGETARPEDLAASFQHAVVKALLDKTMLAALDHHVTRLALAGGVSANSGLRAAFEQACQKAGITLYLPQLKLCGDNAAMIGSAALLPADARRNRRPVPERQARAAAGIKDTAFFSRVITKPADRSFSNQPAFFPFVICGCAYPA